jgi:hypothetical protein
LLRHQPFELGVLRLEPFQPSEFGDAQALVPPSPVVKGLLGDAVLATDIEVIARHVGLAQDLDDLLLAEALLQAPLRLLRGILDENFPWPNFRGAGQVSFGDMAQVQTPPDPVD